MNETELVEKLREYRNEIYRLGKEERLLARELAELRSPFKVGDIITWKSGECIYRAEVEEIFDDWNGQPYRSCTRIRKNGELGVQRIEAHNWDHPELAIVESQGPTLSYQLGGSKQP